MAISLEDVEDVARLARLLLTDEEKHLYAAQLDRIIESFNALEALGTDSIEPLSQTLPLVNVLREDEPAPRPDRESLMANAPEGEAGFFRVPKIRE